MKKEIRLAEKTDNVYTKKRWIIWVFNPAVFSDFPIMEEDTKYPTSEFG